MIKAGLVLGGIIGMLLIWLLVSRIHEYTWNQETHEFNIIALIINSYMLGVFTVVMYLD